MGRLRRLFPFLRCRVVLNGKATRYRILTASGCPCLCDYPGVKEGRVLFRDQQPQAGGKMARDRRPCGWLAVQTADQGPSGCRGAAARG